jgi:hypothetical protein
MVSLPSHSEQQIKDISTLLFSSFVPHKSGSTKNAFFCMNEKIGLNKSIEYRKVTCEIPEELKCIYSKYDQEVEFSVFDWIFLSETEIIERYEQFVKEGQCRCIDIAFRYIGMGHVCVLTYDPVSQHVFEQFDGGANEYDRIKNRKTRVETDIASIVKTPFQEWFTNLKLEA